MEAERYPTGCIPQLRATSCNSAATSPLHNRPAFDAFGKGVFTDGALSAKIKQIIAVAVAHLTQCPDCIKGHTKAARRAGATPQELMEAIWVAAEMRAGGAYAHSALMLDTLSEESH